MSFVIKDDGGNRTPKELIPEDMHDAVCIGIADLGTHTTVWEGKSKEQHKINISWELPAVRDIGEDSDGKAYNRPRVSGKKFTISFHEKATLRKWLERWRNKTFTKDELAGFDISVLVGKPCRLMFVHNENNGKTYSNIDSIMKATPAMAGIQPESSTFCYSIEQDGTNFPESMPEWMREVVMESREMAVAQSPAPAPANVPAAAPAVVNVTEDDADSIPF